MMSVLFPIAPRANYLLQAGETRTNSCENRYSYPGSLSPWVAFPQLVRLRSALAKSRKRERSSEVHGTTICWVSRGYIEGFVRCDGRFFIRCVFGRGGVSPSERCGL